MIASPYRPKRKKNGKTVTGRMWRARIRLHPGDTVTDIPLHTPDKQTAQKFLADRVKELNQEIAGIIPSRASRESAQRPIAEHLEDFLASRESLGRCQKYVRILRNQFERLCSDCKWKTVGDITADSFERWRNKQTSATKTLNGYLGAATVFLNWMEHCSRIPLNPLAKVQSAETRGHQTRQRRAFTETELRALVGVSGRRAAVYLAAAYTGLRRGELGGLQWQDIKGEGEALYLDVRASTTKNKERASIPLHPVLAKTLQALRPRDCSPLARIFRGMIPRMPRFKADLKAAGIAYVDDKGAFADFHSLRGSYATWLTLNGASQREIMAMMRHSDMRLTAKVYTDAGLLPLGKAMLRLPSLLTDAQIDSHFLVPSCPKVSRRVSEGKNGVALQSPDSQSQPANMSGIVPECPSREMVRAAGFEPAIS